MRRAACCCTTNSSGPSLPCAISAGGSGVASKLRLAEYSLSDLSGGFVLATRRILNGNDFEAATGNDSSDDPCGREWVFVQGMVRQFLSGQDEAGRDAGLVRRAPAHRGDQQYVLSDAETGSAGELGQVHARRVSVCDQGVAAHH